MLLHLKAKEKVICLEFCPSRRNRRFVNFFTPKVLDITWNMNHNFPGAFFGGILGLSRLKFGDFKFLGQNFV